MTRTQRDWATHAWKPVSEHTRNSADPGVLLRDQLLDEPLRWRTARRTLVHSDPFHTEVPDEYLAAMWTAMYWTGADVRPGYRAKPVQTFVVLTQCPERMRSWLRQWADLDTRRTMIHAALERGWCDQDDIDYAPFMPTALSSLWLGVSVEDPVTANARVSLLMQTPAAVRCVSADPLLGEVDLTRWLRPAPACGFADPEDGCCTHPDTPTPECHRWVRCPVAPHGRWQGLDWVIVGGESGPGARPMHPRWPRSIREQCRAAGVPLFYRQWGEWAPYGEGEPTLAGVHGPVALVDPQGHTHSVKAGALTPAGSARMARYGTKRAGNALDGEHYQQLPGHYADQDTHRTLTTR